MISWNRLAFLLTIIVFLAFKTSAQKIINDATIIYNISTESMGDKASTAKALEGATLTVYLKGMQSRTDLVSPMGNESNLFDAKAGNGTILKQYSGQKLMITLSGSDWAQKNQFYQNMKFTIENTEQTIAGIKCKRATAKSPEGNTIIIYFDPSVVLANKQYNNAFSQLPGLPVQYELQSGKLKFKYTLSSVNYDPFPASKFEIPKTGFRIMTYQETQQLKKEGE